MRLCEVAGCSAARYFVESRSLRCLTGFSILIYQNKDESLLGSINRSLPRVLYYQVRRVLEHLLKYYLCSCFLEIVGQVFFFHYPPDVISQWLKSGTTNCNHQYSKLPGEVSLK